MPSKYEICSQATVLVGGKPIAGWTQASTEEIVAETLYEATLLELLSAYRWRFASQYVDLTLIDEQPPLEWTGVYQLPPGVTVIHGVYAYGDRIEFDRTEDRLLVDAGIGEQPMALVGFRPDEGDFPPYFVSVLRLKLAAMFAVPLAEDTQKASLYEGMAMRAFAQARAMESQGRTPSKLKVGRLRAVHGGRA